MILALRANQINCLAHQTVEMPARLFKLHLLTFCPMFKKVLYVFVLHEPTLLPTNYVFMSTFDHFEILDRVVSSLENYVTVFFIEFDQNKINHN